MIYHFEKTIDSKQGVKVIIILYNMNLFLCNDLFFSWNTLIVLFVIVLHLMDKQLAQNV